MVIKIKFMKYYLSALHINKVIKRLYLSFQLTLKYKIKSTIKLIFLIY